MKYYPSEIFQGGYIADPQLFNRTLQQAQGIVNGSVDALDLGPDIITAAKVVDNTFNQYTINNTPFGSGTLTLEKGDITGRDWVFPADARLTLTADEDGVIIGGLESTIRCHGQNISDKTYGWQIGVFIDGSLAGCTDRVTVQGWGFSLPFFYPITKGTHTLQVGVKCYAYSASTAGDPNDVIVLYTSQLWWRHAKR